jgi:hypothetical protein
MLVETEQRSGEAEHFGFLDLELDSTEGCYADVVWESSATQQVELLQSFAIRLELEPPGHLLLEM